MKNITSFLLVLAGFSLALIASSGDLQAQKKNKRRKSTVRAALAKAYAEKPRLERN